MISSSVFLASSLPPHPQFLDNLQFQITGILVVIFTLGSLALAMTILGKIFAVVDSKRTARNTETAPIPLPTQPTTGTPTHGSSSEEIPPHIFAVIAAAVSTALGDQRILIHGVHAADPRTNLAWSAEGRRSIYAGKKLR